MVIAALGIKLHCVRHMTFRLQGNQQMLDLTFSLHGSLDIYGGLEAWRPGIKPR